MITGNCLSNIIETNDKENKFPSKDTYKFLSTLNYDMTVDNINNFFTNNINNLSIIPVDHGKYHIDLMIKQNERLKMQYQAYKLDNKGKFMYILSFKKVNIINIGE
jgi:hypothetical protein